MSEDKLPDSDPERTLITLDQLSQTIEVMTSVVNRLRQHLSEQIKAQLEQQAQELEEQNGEDAAQTVDGERQASKKPQKESFVIEIQQSEPNRKNSKILH